MNFDFYFLKSFRLLLFPLALIYGMVIWVRNRLYDFKILKSAGFNLPVICVGNITVGGTGKSPMVEYLAGVLKERYNTAILSRGYKRRSKGYILANEKTTALEVGDEPMQFYLKYPDIPVAVGEERVVAIPQLLYDKPGTEVIILDDAFQHRSVEAGLNILLTDYGNLYTRDFFLPTGDLRDERSSVRRAQVLMVTKCRPEMIDSEREQLKLEIDPLPHQHLFFTSIQYGLPYHIVTGKKLGITKKMEVFLVCGIANPEPLKKFLLEKSKTYEALYFSDHHI
jgi:tetraacyldisaccharide 4'-kinase